MEVGPWNLLVILEVEAVLQIKLLVSGTHVNMVQSTSKWLSFINSDMEKAVHAIHSQEFYKPYCRPLELCKRIWLEKLANVQSFKVETWFSKLNI